MVCESIVSQVSAPALGPLADGIRLAFGLLFFAGFLKCIRLMSRPTTHSYCIAPLALICIVYMSYAFQKLTGTVFSPGVQRIVHWGYFLCFATGFYLGIVGFIEYLVKKGQYKQGLVQAVFGIVLCGGLASLFGLYLLKDSKLAPAWIRPVVLNDQPKKFPDFNCEFCMPASPWCSVPPLRINPNAIGAAQLDRKSMTMAVIAEKLPENWVTTETVLEMAKANIVSVSDSATFEVKEETVNGMNGVRMSSSAIIKGEGVHYSHWVVSVGEYAYQIIVMGPEVYSELIEDMGQIVSETFKQITPVASDPKQTIQLDNHRLPTKTEFPDLNFKFDPPPKPWVQIDVKKMNPDAACGWVSPNEGMHLTVIAEKIGFGLVDQESLTLIVSDNYSLAATNARVSIDWNILVNGYFGSRVFCEGIIEGERFYTTVWVFENLGYAYQVTIGGSASKREAINREALKLTQNFHLLDRSKAALPSRN